MDKDFNEIEIEIEENNKQKEIKRASELAKLERETEIEIERLEEREREISKITKKSPIKNIDIFETELLENNSILVDKHIDNQNIESIHKK